EDEQDCIDLIRQTLDDIPCELLTAMDGEETLQVARAQKPQLIILDVHMPKKDGFTVFNELQNDKELAGIPVVMLTAIAERTGVKFDADDMGQFMGSEPDAYIDKPIEPILLKQVVNKLIK
ncbi:MAG: response regulator, partial [Planctomycetota bacterium]